MESRTSLLLIVLLIAITQQKQTVVGQQGGEGGDCVVSISLQADGIVPDVVDRAPCRLIQVSHIILPDPSEPLICPLTRRLPTIITWK